MPNLKKNPSALKCARRDARKAVYRGTVRTSTRTHIKKARALLAAGKVTEAEQALQVAVQALDKAAEKGVHAQEQRVAAQVAADAGPEQGQGRLRLRGSQRPCRSAPTERRFCI